MAQREFYRYEVEMVALYGGKTAVTLQNRGALNEMLQEMCSPEKQDVAPRLRFGLYRRFKEGIVEHVSDHYSLALAIHRAKQYPDYGTGGGLFDVAFSPLIIELRGDTSHDDT